MKEIITDYYALSERCDEIDVRKEGKKVQEIVKELKQVVREKNLKGLSANQIGYDKRILVINFNGDIRSFVNPIITKVSGIELSRETCSSIPDKTYIRIRNNNIEVTYLTPLGKVESRKMFGMAANVFQHHIDHLDGLLLSDVALEIDEDFDSATDEEREQIINMYLDSLDIKRKEIDEEIQNNEDLNKMSQAIDFIEKVQRGEVEVMVEKIPKQQQDEGGEHAE